MHGLFTCLLVTAAVSASAAEPDQRELAGVIIQPPLFTFGHLPRRIIAGRRQPAERPGATLRVTRNGMPRSFPRVSHPLWVVWSD